MRRKEPPAALQGIDVKVTMEWIPLETGGQGRWDDGTHGETPHFFGRERPHPRGRGSVS